MTAPATAALRSVPRALWLVGGAAVIAAFPWLGMNGYWQREVVLIGVYSLVVSG